MSAFGISVAVIEDNDDHYKIIEKLLKEKQPDGFVIRYDIARFDELEKSIKGLYARNPDIILLDLNLPDSNGKKTFDRLIESTVVKGVPIIVLTVLTNIELGLQCMREGAYGYFVKDWVDKNPLLLHFYLINAHEIHRQQEEIRFFIGERLGEFRPLIPRCKYCEKRQGTARWKDESNNIWMDPDKYVEKYGINFTDGVCPDCFAVFFKTLRGGDGS